jgi:hypothetical protein
MEIDRLADPYVDWRIILKWFLRNRMGMWINLAQNADKFLVSTVVILHIL